MTTAPTIRAAFDALKPRNALQGVANMYKGKPMGDVLQALVDLDRALDPYSFDMDAFDAAVHEVRGLTEHLIGEAELEAASNRDIPLNYGGWDE